MTTDQMGITKIELLLKSIEKKMFKINAKIFNEG